MAPKKTKDQTSKDRKCIFASLKRSKYTNIYSPTCISCGMDIRQTEHGFANNCEACDELSSLCDMELVKIYDINSRAIIGQIAQCSVCLNRYEEPIVSICPNKIVATQCTQRSCKDKCIHRASSMTYSTTVFLECNFDKDKQCSDCGNRITEVQLKNLKYIGIYCKTRNERNARMAKTLLKEKNMIKKEIYINLEATDDEMDEM